ncbi:MAG TPA: MoxR family ATPase [Candidatus Sumerlaeota bacterium]|nr:MAG: Holliday junction DNA helicase RuvB [candidate division BRC1 bacterium ADurb.BinA292]HPK01771.1 MoxR family ATPase [Candidatus Sumerlaeota bacterium]
MQEALSAKAAHDDLRRLEQNIELVIRGKHQSVRMAITGLLAGGHVLFEDVPGVGKTTLAQCLAMSINVTFQRIQGTSDLLPSDILGVSVWDNDKKAFVFRAGPIFANIVLVDEINRTTPKTQSALLEAMNTAQVSIDRNTYDLAQPFMVIATQNPFDSHGTFPLPKSQLDRFMMRLHLGYPDAEYEREILRNTRSTGDLTMVKPVLSSERIRAMQEGVRRVRVDDSLVDYIVNLINATRHSPLIELGASTRAALALRNCAKANAYMDGRDYAIPDDVKAVAVSVLAHRLGIIRTFEETAESLGEGSSAVRAILEETPVPI